MTLSVKVALLTSLGFISGMSWLVSNVARPIAELPTPLIARGLERGGVTAGVFAKARDVSAPTRRGPEIMARHFERPSTMEAVNRNDAITGDALLVADVASRDEQLAPKLPPLFMPDAPVVAYLDETVETAVPEVDVITAEPYEPVLAGTSMDESASHGLRMLAALRPEAEQQTSEPAAQATNHADRTYVVRRGDSLVKIMRREWNRSDDQSLHTLLAANPEVAKRRNKIFPGEVLNIPEPRPADAVASERSSDELASSLSTKQPPTASFCWYTIKKSDSLAGIARRHLKDPNRWHEIAQLNRLRNADKIMPGMRIKLPTLRMDT